MPWRSILLPVALAHLALSGDTAQAELQRAHDQASLQAALKTMASGGELVLARADYGSVEIAGRFTKALTIRSEDPDRPARFARLVLRQTQNVRLRNLDVGGASPTGRPRHEPIATIRDARDIVLENLHLHGSLNKDPSDDPQGLVLTDTADVTLSKIIFEDLLLGIAAYRSQNLRIENSAFRYLQSDGIDLAGVKNAILQRNVFSHFYPATDDHPDAIQCWTRNQAHGCQDIFIANNLIVSSKLRRIQGIFFGDEVDLWRSGAGHARIRVADNIIISPMWHAISFYQATEVEITKNLVLNQAGGQIVPGGPVRPWIYTSNPGAKVLGNTAPFFDIAGVKRPAKGNKESGSSERADIASIISQWSSRSEPLVGDELEP